MMMTLVRLLRTVFPLVAGDRPPSRRAGSLVLERLQAADARERSGRDTVSSVPAAETTLGRAAR